MNENTQMTLAEKLDLLHETVCLIENHKAAIEKMNTDIGNLLQEKPRKWEMINHIEMLREFRFKQIEMLKIKLMKAKNS